MINENVKNQMAKPEVRTVFGFGSGTAKAAGQTPSKIPFSNTPLKSASKRDPLGSAKKLFTTSQQLASKPQSSSIPVRTPLKQMQRSQSTMSLHTPASVKKVATDLGAAATPSKSFMAKEAAKQAKAEADLAKITKTRELKDKW